MLSSLIAESGVRLIAAVSARWGGRRIARIGAVRRLFTAHLLVLLCGLSLSSPASAARVDGLYRVRLPVTEQQLQVDPALAREALQAVLVRVSGRQQLAGHGAIDDALRTPTDYIQQFSYLPNGKVIVDAAGRQQPGFDLQIEFIAPLVDSLLKRAQMLPLGVVRPGVLVWIVEERRGQRSFIGIEEDPVLKPMLARAAARGLPLFRPLLDLDDQAALTPADAWAFFENPVLDASSRYQSDAVLVGRIYPVVGGWQSRWMLLRNGERTLFDGIGGEGVSIEAQLTRAVDETADHLFGEFLSQLPEPGAAALLIEVARIDSFDDHAQLLDYLQESPLVGHLRLVSQKEDRLTLALDLNGSADQLRSTLGLNPRLIPLPSPEALQTASEAEASRAPQLFYRWGE